MAEVRGVLSQASRARPMSDDGTLVKRQGKHVARRPPNRIFASIVQEISSSYGQQYNPPFHASSTLQSTKLLQLRDQTANVLDLAAALARRRLCKHVSTVLRLPTTAGEKGVNAPMTLIVFSLCAPSTP